MAATKASLTTLVRDLWGSGFSISRWYIPGHDGVDLPANAGTPVRAVASGTVEFAKDARTLSKADAYKGWAYGGGKVVNINIGGSKATQYAHLNSIAVSEGQYVKKGQIIGTVGTTGGLTKSGGQGGANANFVGSHLHFGLWDKSKNAMVDPTTFLLAQRAGWDSGTGKDDVTTSKTLGAWGNLINLPEGKIITQADVDMMITKLRDAGWFPGSVGAGTSGVGIPGLGEYQARYVLETYAIGKPWNKDLQDELAVQFGAQAQASGSDATIAALAGALGPFGTLIGEILDPGNWIRILALFAGLAMAAYGTINILRATGGTPSPV